MCRFGANDKLLSRSCSGNRNRFRARRERLIAATINALPRFAYPAFSGLDRTNHHEKGSSGRPLELQLIKIRYVILPPLALLIATAPLHAQDGCTDSPEAPTALLMLVGTAGMFFGSSVLRKVLRRAGNR